MIFSKNLYGTTAGITTGAAVAEATQCLTDTFSITNQENLVGYLSWKLTHFKSLEIIRYLFYSLPWCYYIFLLFIQWLTENLQLAKDDQFNLIHLIAHLDLLVFWFWLKKIMENQITNSLPQYHLVWSVNKKVIVSASTWAKKSFKFILDGK